MRTANRKKGLQDIMGTNGQLQVLPRLLLLPSSVLQPG
jgi:hypothetical protein